MQRQSLKLQGRYTDDADRKDKHRLISSTDKISVNPCLPAGRSLISVMRVLNASFQLQQEGFDLFKRLNHGKFFFRFFVFFSNNL